MENEEAFRAGVKWLTAWLDKCSSTRFRHDWMKADLNHYIDLKRDEDARAAKKGGGMKDCWLHESKGEGFKRGCKDCQDANREGERDEDSWHDLWERDNFGDRD